MALSARTSARRLVSPRKARRAPIRRYLAAVAMLVTGFAPAASQATGPVQILVLSNRADVISGGDALVQVALPAGTNASTVGVDVDGRDVTGSFATRADGRFLGLVTGLAVGPNVLTASLPDGSGARITITNYSIGGPVLSGAQVQPWLCTTASNGLGQPVDAQCNAPMKYAYFYKSVSGGALRAYDPANPAPDVAQTTTDRGVTVPYIVRREMGTQNRGIYAIAVLADPAQTPAPWSPPAAWNGKMYYPFGASCGTVHAQGSPTGVLDDNALSKGFMVANSSLNVLGSNCNTIVSAESTMMLKERIVEAYGEIRFTFGSGCSGGSIGQHMVANAYPGLVDGIQPTCSYADTWSTGIQVADCHLLLNYFNNTSPHLWAVAAQRMVADGTMSPSSCIAWEALFAPVLDPRNGCGLPADQQYHPQNNPGGCRGTLPDYMASVIGRRPQDGFGKLPYDNIGVQYGLTALQSGAILPEQFVDMNEKIGAFDIDFNYTTQRREADPGSLKVLYQSGQINDGGRLDMVPIIDLRGSSNHEIHADYHTYVMRERLDRANGHHDNQIVWSNHGSLAGDPVATGRAFLLMDKWLAAIEADTSDAPKEAKVVRNKPAEAVDSCWFAGLQVTDKSLCRAAIPYFGSPRIAAGGPTTHDVGKCALKALNRTNYNVSFTGEQWTRLQAAFPGGVCDWSKPGVDQEPSKPWMSFAGGPGGQPLGDPPASMPIVL